MAKNKKKIKKAANVSGFWKQTAKSTKKNVKKYQKQQRLFILDMQLQL